MLTEWDVRTPVADGVMNAVTLVDYHISILTVTTRRRSSFVPCSAQCHYGGGDCKINACAPGKSVVKLVDQSHRVALGYAVGRSCRVGGVFVRVECRGSD